MTPSELWFPTAISQLQISGGFTITLITNRPCHLWLYWTDRVPWVHRTSTITRGLPVPWDAYWCYVVWRIIDQDEPGDTLIHTYQWTGWQTCQTKYFRFHGNINGITSPSDSPIYSKHFIEPEAPYYFDYPIKVPNVYDYNMNWVASSFECLKTGTPTKLGIWLWNYGLRPFDMKLYIEESVNQPPGIVSPYDNITGHILCEGTIPAADINAHIRVFWYHEVTLDTATPLATGTHYIFTSDAQDSARAYRYRTHDIIIADILPTFWHSPYAAPPVRSWTRAQNLPVKAGQLS